MRYPVVVSRKLHIIGSLLGISLFLISLTVKQPSWQEVWNWLWRPLVAPGQVANLTPIVAPVPEVSTKILGISSNDEMIATVSSVVDGDTIVLVGGKRVRYIGVDTPETKHPKKSVECFGKEASARNAELVLGKTVRLEKDVSETDRYGRLLRYVWVDDRMINEQLVAEGFAFARSYPPDIAKQKIFAESEKKAQTTGVGLWSACPL